MVMEWRKVRKVLAESSSFRQMVNLFEQGQDHPPRGVSRCLYLKSMFKQYLEQELREMATKIRNLEQTVGKKSEHRKLRGNFNSLYTVGKFLEVVETGGWKCYFDPLPRSDKNART
jgi:hypothetical protein